MSDTKKSQPKSNPKPVSQKPPDPPQANVTKIIRDNQPTQPTSVPPKPPPPPQANITTVYKADTTPSAKPENKIPPPPKANVTRIIENNKPQDHPTINKSKSE